jgi:putative acetyltransferase
MRLRRFQIGDEQGLYDVFYSAVHYLAAGHYSREQLEAWAPGAANESLWAQRMQAIRPFVIEEGGAIVAYADVQASGYIDHFFVSGSRARRGLGALLMQHIIQHATELGTKELSSHVSRAAEAFFSRFDFVVIEQRAPMVRGVIVPNALMRRQLAGGPDAPSN